LEWREGWEYVADGPPEHWQFLLAAQFVARGHEVRYPVLPDPDAPQLEQGLAVLNDELAALGGQPSACRSRILQIVWLASCTDCRHPGASLDLR